MLGLVREEQKRWWRLSFLAEEVEWAERHLVEEVVIARDAGWSWRRLGAATGIPAETLRQRFERLEAAGGLPCSTASSSPRSPEGSPRHAERPPEHGTGDLLAGAGDGGGAAGS